MKNPLASGPSPPQQSNDPMMLHARMWQHVATARPQETPGALPGLNRLVPVLGALASNPKVTAKDVIKAAAGTTADGITSPEASVQFITQIPTDPDKIQPWLKQHYAASLSALVHMKAALLQNAQGMPQQAPQSVPQPAQPSPPQGAPPS